MNALSGTLDTSCIVHKLQTTKHVSAAVFYFGFGVETCLVTHTGETKSG